MTQKNFMSARAVTVEEMENVNGGMRSMGNLIRSARLFPK